MNDELDMKQKIDNWYKEHAEKLRIKNEKMNELISSTDYIEWLANFLKDTHSFSDEDWMYFLDLFENKDRLNMAKICLLYEVVSRYASKNNIDINICDYGNYYKVIYQDFCFDIGARLNQGVMFFCKEDRVDDKDIIVDFNNILEIKEKKKKLIKK